MGAEKTIYNIKISNNELIKTLKRIGLIRHDEIQMNIDQTIKMITKSQGEPIDTSNKSFIDL